METMSGLKRLPLLMGLALALAMGAATVLVVDTLGFQLWVNLPPAWLAVGLLVGASLVLVALLLV